MSKVELEKVPDMLEKGDFSKAEKILAKAEATEELTLQEFASVAFNRGEIAYQESRWKDAAEHYARSARLDSSFINLIMAQKLAHVIGDYDSALSFGVDAQKAAIAEHGEKTEEYATSLNNLGQTYRSRGQIKEAESLHREALRIRNKLFGENSRLTANSFSNLAGVYSSQGSYKEAEYFFKKALEIDGKVLGDDHGELATDMNNLGTVYEYQGIYDKAELYYQKALKIREKKLMKNHPSIANSLNNLAVLYEKKNEDRDVESFYLRAIKILESNFGSEHPHTKLVKGNYERFINASAQAIHA